MNVITLAIFIVATGLVSLSADKIDLDRGDCTLEGLSANVQSQLQYIELKDGTWQNLAWPTFIKVEKKNPTTVFRVKCKTVSNTWTNGFRILDGIDADVIDQKSESGTTQDGIVKFTCTSNNITPSWLTKYKNNYCNIGCPLLPNTPVDNWQSIYPSTIVSNTSDEAPIKQGDDKVEISCVAGSAPKNGGKSSTLTKCTSTGYSNLGDLIECVTGCTDISKQGIGTKVDTAPSITAGEAPYNIGDVVSISCNDAAFAIAPPVEYTCLSTQRWNSEQTPVCKAWTSASTVAEIVMVVLVLSVTVILAL